MTSGIVDSVIDSLLGFLAEWGFRGTTALLLVLLIILFLNPNKFTRWMRIFYSVLNFLVVLPRRYKYWIEKGQIAAQIEETINELGGRINDEAPNMLPHALSIEWVKEEQPTAFIDRGEAIVRLKYHTNQDRNIVDSTLMYLDVGLLPRARNCLDKALRKACDYNIAKRIFMARLDTDAYDYFMVNYVDPDRANDADFSDDIQMVEDLDGVGFLTRVFLNEVLYTYHRLMGTIATDAVRGELRSFARHLQRIANKGWRQKVPLTLKGSRLNVSIVLIAKQEVIQNYGIHPYINRVARCVREGSDTLYICAWGEEFIKRALEIKAEVEKRKYLTVLRPYTYAIPRFTGWINKGIILVCQSAQAYFTLRRKLEERVRQLMNQHIPEIAGGTLKIIGIARQIGIGSKVLVRDTTGELTGEEVRQICVGEDYDRVDAIKQQLEGEFVGIVPWVDEPATLVRYSLRPAREVHIKAVNIDEEDLIADVEVYSEDGYGKAIGSEGWNVRLASELTGWYIKVQPPSGVERAPIPVEILKHKLREHVAEIQSGLIEMVAASRIVGLGSKVLVRWRSESQARGRLAKNVCMGTGHSVVKQISSELKEWVNLHEWHPQAERTIVECLYPLDYDDVVSVTLDEERNLALVLVSGIDCLKMATGKGMNNVMLAERVSGWQIDLRVAGQEQRSQ